jgi:hypothetical protein
VRQFAPDALRDLAPAERAGGEPAAYLKLEGALGRQTFSDIKRPRPLMDLDQTTSADSQVPHSSSSLRTYSLLN